MDVQLPDGTVIKGIPEGTTKAQLAEKLKANGRDVPKEWTSAPKGNYEQATDEMSGLQKFGAGIGGAMVGAGLGIKQAAAGIGNKIGLVSDQAMQGVNNDVQNFQEAQQSLNKTGAGLAGNIAGGAAVLAPTAFI